MHRHISPFGSVKASARPPGIFGKGRQLQAQVLGGALAVQSKVLSQVLQNGLHRMSSPFGSIKALSPASGHHMVNGLFI